MFRYSFAICWRAARWCLRCCRYVSFSFLLFYLFKLLDRRKNCFIVERISCRHRLNRKKKRNNNGELGADCATLKKILCKFTFPTTDKTIFGLVDRSIVCFVFVLSPSLSSLYFQLAYKSILFLLAIHWNLLLPFDYDIRSLYRLKSTTLERMPSRYFHWCDFVIAKQHQQKKNKKKMARQLNRSKRIFI